MMTGSTDDGSYSPVSFWVSQSLEGEARDQNSGSRDLRNTALGASSPAKPALHMPELLKFSFCYRTRKPQSSICMTTA